MQGGSALVVVVVVVCAVEGGTSIDKWISASSWLPEWSVGQARNAERYCRHQAGGVGRARVGAAGRGQDRARRGSKWVDGGVDIGLRCPRARWGRGLQMQERRGGEGKGRISNVRRDWKAVLLGLPESRRRCYRERTALSMDLRTQTCERHPTKP